MNPKTEALAFKIWCFADPRGWDVTVQEIAEACDCKWQTVVNICRHRGWTNRIRHTKPIGSPFHREMRGLTSESLFEGLA